jgi:hypothetical protein
VYKGSSLGCSSREVADPLRLDPCEVANSVGFLERVELDRKAAKVGPLTKTMHGQGLTAL